jgi:hypothetical protein
VAFLEVLASGKLGLLVRPPAQFVIAQQTETSATLQDPSAGLMWWMFWFPDLHLDVSLEHEPLLRRHIERHTRLLFATMFDVNAGGTGLSSEVRPRTDDANWSPVIEIERRDVDGGVALDVLHRMQYQPGGEIIMGHTLVPVHDGLFEARWLAREQGATGLRESVVLMKTIAAGSDADFLPQAAYDHPEYDIEFPDHPLSRARAAKGWTSVGTLRVTHPFVARKAFETPLHRLGCAITPPPRFVLSDDDAESCRFSRVSFAGTDGVDRLIVTRTNERLRGIAVARRLLKHATAYSRAICESSGLADIDCRVLAADSEAVTLITEGESGTVGCGRARAVWIWFVGPSSKVWSIAIATTIAVPVDELVADVGSVRQSWRMLESDD